jgi:hypothetical protein
MRGRTDGQGGISEVQQLEEGRVEHRLPS